MCLEEYDAEFHERSLRQEEHESGRQEGIIEGRRQGISEGRQEGILGTVHLLTNMGLDKETILHKISQEFNLTVEEASSYVHSDNR